MGNPLFLLSVSIGDNLSPYQQLRIPYRVLRTYWFLVRRFRNHHYNSGENKAKGVNQNI